MNIKIKIGIVGLCLVSSLFVSINVDAQATTPKTDSELLRDSNKTLINKSDTDFSKDVGIVTCGRHTKETDPGLNAVDLARLNVKECDFAAFMSYINRLVNYAIILATLLMVGMIAYTGFEYLKAGDSPGTLSKLKERLWSIVIGIFIMLIAWLGVSTFAESVLINDYIKSIYLK